MFLKFSFLPGSLPKLHGMALQENKGGFENLSPPSSNAYLKGHHFPLVAAIIKAQVINCFFVIINCEGSPKSRNYCGRERKREREGEREREGAISVPHGCLSTSRKEREGVMNFLQ